MSGAAILLIIISVCSNGYQLLIALCGILFRVKQQRKITDNKWPKVACLKPLCGRDREVQKNLESFVNQDYPDYEIIFGVASRDDSVYQIARSVCQANPDKNTRVILGELGEGANRKVRNLRNIYANLSPDVEIIVLSDSDTRVTRDYLKQMVMPIHNDPGVGAVTAIYRIERTKAFADIIEALSVESIFVPGVLVTDRFSDLKFAFGASIAINRSAFVKAGGFEPIEDYLADDYQIGKIIYQSGKRVVLSPYVVSIIPPGQNPGKTLSHLLRWNRTVRVCSPIGYFFSVICYSTFWALMAFMGTGANQIGWTVLGGTCLIRILAAVTVSVSIRSPAGIFRAFLTPIWDLLSILIWLFGLVGNRVTWRGTKYRVFSDGRMSEIE